MIYDNFKRIAICEDRALKGTSIFERIYFLDAADILREKLNLEVETIFKEYSEHLKNYKLAKQLNIIKE